jgi:hypothetical protein
MFSTEGMGYNQLPELTFPILSNFHILPIHPNFTISWEDVGKCSQQYMLNLHSLAPLNISTVFPFVAFNVFKYLPIIEMCSFFLCLADAQVMIFPIDHY